jgi:membrane dipeptidase
MKASTKPVLMTHGGCAAIHPHPRNKTDADLRALAQKGGVFGIYDLFYLAPSPRQPNLDDYIAHMTHALDVCGEDHVGIGSDASFDVLDVSPEARANWDKLLAARKESGMAAPEEDRMPYTEGLNRADRTLVIADALLRHGYSARVAEKVLGANFVRAFREIW